VIAPVGLAGAEFARIADSVHLTAGWPRGCSWRIELPVRRLVGARLRL